MLLLLLPQLDQMHGRGLAWRSHLSCDLETLFYIGVVAAITLPVTACFCCFFVFHIISIKDLKGFGEMQNARMPACDV